LALVDAFVASEAKVVLVDRERHGILNVFFWREDFLFRDCPLILITPKKINGPVVQTTISIDFEYLKYGRLKNLSESQAVGV